jgi:nucleotide-binding universal stress UspA family protein
MHKHLPLTEETDATILPKRYWFARTLGNSMDQKLAQALGPDMIMIAVLSVELWAYHVPDRRLGMINIQKILYATDFSSYSNQAYFHAITLAEAHEASLAILFVYDPDRNEGDEENRKYWRNQLEQIRPINPHIPVRHVFLEGNPADEIVRHARGAGMDLIVMGTHGRTGLERLLMGSVAEKVMREANCSVLVVKLPKAQPQTKGQESSKELSPV